jgi:Ni/Fe-hydrogenase 1 B-type cytochrome subunit
MALHPHKRDEHPGPAVLMHWVHLVSIIGLVITGLDIHRPFAAWPMATVRTIHFLLMYFLVINLVVRIYWAFVGQGSASHSNMARGKIRDYRYFGPEPENKGKLVEIVKYYLFMRKEHPATSKFNTLQKVTYVFWIPLIILQAITGFSIYGPTQAWPFFSSITMWLGGLQMVRNYHYLIMWVFILTVAIHVYLAVAEDASAFLLMFFWKETPAKKAA